AEKHQPGTQPVEYNIHDGLLKSRTKVGHVLVAERRDLFRFQAQRGLQVRERKIGILPSVHRPRQLEARRVAAPGFLLDLWSAWIAESKEFCGLVEGLADRVVLGGAKAHIVAYPANCHDLGMTARRQEQAVGKGDSVSEA